jgi:CheY-like chemotaxis protein
LILGDSGRLQQVFWNLLSNALKFTPEGGWVEVRLKKAQSHVEISVTDSGEGIPDDFLPNVFDRFRQADSSITRKYGGLGLGLAIVRHLVELHGGKIQAASPGAGKGAIFTLQLPALAAAKNAVKPAPSSAAPLRQDRLPEAGSEGARIALQGLKIMVVEDEEDCRNLLVTLLSPHGALVYPTGSVQQALEGFQGFSPHIVISDIGMPDADGYALIRALRSRKVAFKAIALTAHARSEDRQQALASGYDVHLAKPLNPALLFSAIESLAAPPPL